MSYEEAVRAWNTENLGCYAPQRFVPWTVTMYEWKNDHNK